MRRVRVVVFVRVVLRLELQEFPFQLAQRDMERALGRWTTGQGRGEEGVVG